MFSCVNSTKISFTRYTLNLGLEKFSEVAFALLPPTNLKFSLKHYSSRIEPHHVIMRSVMRCPHALYP